MNQYFLSVNSQCICMYVIYLYILIISMMNVVFAILHFVSVVI